MKLNTVKASKASKATKAVKAKAPKAVAQTTRDVIVHLSCDIGRGDAFRFAAGTFEGSKLVGLTLKQGQTGACRDAEICKVVDGILSPETKPAGLQFAKYLADGTERKGKVKVEVLTGAQLVKLATAGVGAYAKFQAPKGGFFIGDHKQKRIYAFATVFNGKPHFWQIEGDSNSNNKHERGYVTPLSELDPKADKALIASATKEIEQARKAIAAIK
jgi:hypothetical protein